MPIEEDGNLGDNKRVPAPSYEKLCEVIDDVERSMTILLGASDDDLAAAHKRYKDLKTTRDQYEDAAHKLETYLERIGSAAELGELRRSRREWRQELKKAIRDLNKILSQEGIDVTVMADTTNTSVEAQATKTALVDKRDPAPLSQPPELSPPQAHDSHPELDRSQLLPEQDRDPDVNDRPWSPILPADIGHPRYASSRVDDLERLSIADGQGQQMRERSVRAPSPSLTRHSADSTASGGEHHSMHLARTIMLGELMKAPAEPFTGVAGKYGSWSSILKNRMDQVPGITDMERLQILLMHTSGVPNKIISDYHETVTAETATPTVAAIWDVLQKRYGNTIANLNRIDQRVTEFPVINSSEDGEKFYDLYDLCRHIQSLMTVHRQMEKYNYSHLRHLTDKLPFNVFNRWRSHATRSKARSGEEHQLSTFIEFLSMVTQEFNDPSLQYRPGSKPSTVKKSGERTPSTRALVTEAESSERPHKPPPITCPVHHSRGHHIKDCETFASWTYKRKSDYVRDKGLCFRCLSSAHPVRKCPEKVPVCDTCKKQHLTVLHGDFGSKRDDDVSKEDAAKSAPAVPATVVSSRTNPLEQTNSHLVFSKTFAVELRDRHSKKSIQCLAIVDEQSTYCFADTEVKEALPVNSSPHLYNLKTLSGLSTEVNGFRLDGLEVRGVGERKWYRMPTVLTNDCIPDTRHEMATPDIVKHIRGKAHLAKNFVQPAPDLKPLLMIGLTMDSLMWSKMIGKKAPYVYRTRLGYAVVGSVPRAWIPSSLVPPAPRSLLVLRAAAVQEGHDSLSSSAVAGLPTSHTKFTSNTDVYETRSDDDQKAWSQEDRLFIDKMKSGIKVGENGRLTLPLPFRHSAPTMPPNQGAVLHRTKTALDRLKTQPEVLQKCVKSMEESITNRYVEEVPQTEVYPRDPQRAGWIPIFVVRGGKPRIVFDCKATFKGKCINDHLLQGPDMNNSIRGVIVRFRRFEVGFCCDIKAMYNNFEMPEGDRDYLRFFWYKKNDPEQELVQYRPIGHIFGARSSPAVAMYALKWIVQQAYEKGALSDDAVRFVDESFYVDDGTDSSRSSPEAIDILRQVTAALAPHHLKLHKVISSSPEVMEALGAHEGSNPTVVDILPPEGHRTLGVKWNTVTDRLVIEAAAPEKPFTKRGVLSTVNSTFDPSGLLDPVVLQGRLLQRSILTKSHEEKDWDAPLAEEMKLPWENWKQSLRDAPSVSIPRCMLPGKFADAKTLQLLVFADASAVAIGYVIYLRATSDDNEVHISFVMGNSKVSPKAATTIPKLELCAAVEATKAAIFAATELGVSLLPALFFSDSMIVLGYLRNTTKCFSCYVTRRTEYILTHTSVDQWRFVETHENAADLATRPMTVQQLNDSVWFTGPEFIRTPEVQRHPEEPPTPELPEEIPTVASHRAAPEEPTPLRKLVDRTGSWEKIVRVVQRILSMSRRVVDHTRQLSGMALAPRSSEVEFHEAELVVIRDAQLTSLTDEYSRLKNGKGLPENHKLTGLAPFLDDNGLIRVGGRLDKAPLSYDVRHPVLLPEHPASLRLLTHLHEQCAHQGRHITSGHVRLSGYQPLNMKKSISRLIKQCVPCRKQRGTTTTQKMADLPEERLERSPPFQQVGIDCFGPFYTSEGKTTRARASNKKMFVLLLTCLTSRAVHLEPLAGMDTPSFLLAMRRFFAIRGGCTLIRSDRGSNFVGALSQSSEFERVKSELSSRGCRWSFNPVGASHFGGIYERKIASVRRILEATLAAHPHATLNRDEMTTLLHEAGAIVNATPLYEVSDDPNDPCPITPAMLLTQKVDPHAAVKDDDFDKRDLLAYGPRRWRRIGYLADSFWQRWRTHYLQELSRRQKWKTARPNIQTGDVVLLKGKNSPRNEWPMGVITSCVIAEDGLVRRVFVDIIACDGKKKNTEKAVHDLVLLYSPNTASSEGQCAGCPSQQ